MEKHLAHTMFARVQLFTVCLHNHNFINTRGSRIICALKRFRLHDMVHPLLHATLSTSSQSLPSTSPVLLSSSSPAPDPSCTNQINHCEDPRQDGGSSNLHSSTGYEPKKIELDRNLVNPQNSIIDDQDYIEQIGVKQSSNSQSLAHSAYDSAENIAPDSNLEDKQKRKMLANEN